MTTYSDIVMNNFRIFNNIKCIPQELETQILSFLYLEDKNKFLNSLLGHFIKTETSTIKNLTTSIKKKEYMFSYFSERNSKLNSYLKKFQRTKKSNTKKLFKIKRKPDYYKFLKTSDYESNFDNDHILKYENKDYILTKNIVYQRVDCTYDYSYCRDDDYYGPVIEDTCLCIVVEDKNTYIFLEYYNDFLIIYFKLIKNMKYDYVDIKIIKIKFQKFLFRIYRETQDVYLLNTLRQFFI